MLKIIMLMISFIILFSNVLSFDLKWCYKKTFKVSAYYSPAVWQKFYYKWNYYKEVKLNWKGIRWASWKKVFNWMIAAPKSYKFWTKIYFPELNWVWQVEDRWQAIVHAWERTEKYDRIDIWVWKWDKALIRALSFWKKTMVWYVCPKYKKLNIWFDYSKFPVYKNFFRKTLWWVWLYLWRNDKRVEILQEYLNKLWFLKHKPTWYFWYLTKKAVTKFQKFYWIKTRWFWYFWPKTRSILKKILSKKWLLRLKNKKNKIALKDIVVVSPVELQKERIRNELLILKRWLWKWYHTYEVKILQKYLKQLWYYSWSINWFYDDKTVIAVSKFQLDNWIISSPNSLVAGWFWPKTREILKQVILK